MEDPPLSEARPVTSAPIFLIPELVGIQIVPQMAKLPGTQVTNFLRGPTWVYYRVSPSKHLGREIDDPNPAYSEEDKKRFREDPEELRKYRKGIIQRVNKAFRMVNFPPPLFFLLLFY